MVLKGLATRCLVALCLALAGCSSNDADGGGSTPVEQTNLPEEGTVMLSWDTSGRLTGDDECGTNGIFRPADDCADATPLGLPCTEWDEALTGPDGEPGFAVSERKVCVRGTVQQVVNGSDGMPAYSEMWGAKVALSLSGSDGTSPFDATACGIRGFRFDLERSGELSDVRVRLHSGAEPGSLFETAVLPARDFEFVFDRLGKGQDDLSPPPSPDEIHSLDFELYSNASRPKPFDFCISDLRLLTNVVR
jgi:hypothetical protein